MVILKVLREKKEVSIVEVCTGTSKEEWLTDWDTKVLKLLHEDIAL